MAAGVGTITLVTGVLILCGIPGLSTLGTTGGCLFSALGILMVFSGVFLKCIKERDRQGSEHFTQADQPKPQGIISQEPQLSQWDIRGEKPITNIIIFDYLDELAEHYPKFKIPQWGTDTVINDEENTVNRTIMKLLNDPENAEAEAFAFHLHLSGSTWAHHTLVFIDCIKRTVEFYDNVVQSANHKEVATTLTEVAKILSQRKPGSFPFKLECKITKPLLGNCGVWAMYFVENRLKDPNVDFNSITPSQGEKLLRECRELVTQRLKD